MTTLSISFQYTPHFFFFHFYCIRWNLQKNYFPTLKCKFHIGGRDLYSVRCWRWLLEHGLARGRHQYLPCLVAMPPSASHGLVTPTSCLTRRFVPWYRCPMPVPQSISWLVSLEHSVPSLVLLSLPVLEACLRPRPPGHRTTQPFRRAASACSFSLLVASECMCHWIPFGFWQIISSGQRSHSWTKNPCIRTWMVPTCPRYHHPSKPVSSNAAAANHVCTSLRENWNPLLWSD